VVIIALPVATPKSNKNTAKFALSEFYNGTRKVLLKGTFFLADFFFGFWVRS
jgi:hypothetical protein